MNDRKKLKARLRQKKYRAMRLEYENDVNEVSELIVLYKNEEENQEVTPGKFYLLTYSSLYYNKKYLLDDQKQIII